MRVEEAQLAGGLPYVAIGSGPPLVILGRLSAEHGPPSDMERRPPLRTFGPPFQRLFRIHLASRRARLPTGTTMADHVGQIAVAVRDRTRAGPSAGQAEYRARVHQHDVHTSALHEASPGPPTGRCEQESSLAW
jgi:hypothetical protein